MSITEPDQLLADGLVTDTDDQAPTLDILADQASTAAGGDESAPTANPPSETATTTTDGATATRVVSGKKVLALYSVDSSLYGFASIEDEGWRKVSNKTASGYANLTAVLSNAYQTGGTCQVTLTDNVITTAYAF